MQAAIITYPGIEQYTAAELKELLGVTSTVQERVVTFTVKKPEDLVRTAYRLQSGKHLLLVVKDFTFKDKKDICNSIAHADMAPYIGAAFAVRCVRIGQHPFTSREIEEGVGKNIKGTVDLEHPAVVVLVVLVKDRCIIGIDCAGFDLSKRQYRIFSHGALKAPVAYALLRFAGYDAKKIMLDPFCGDGLLAIEAAHIASKFPVQHFVKEGIRITGIPCFRDLRLEKLFAAEDRKSKSRIPGKIFCIDASFANLKSAEKNAKIAGINKLLHFSRMELDWLDTKFDKRSVDCIVTSVPQPNKRSDEKEMAKLYGEFFYQAEHVLKQQGCIVAELNPLLEESAGRKGFAVEERLQVQQGGRTFVFGKLQKR